MALCNIFQPNISIMYLSTMSRPNIAYTLFFCEMIAILIRIHDRLVKLVKGAMHKMYYLPNFLVLDPDPEYCLNKIMHIGVCDINF